MSGAERRWLEVSVRGPDPEGDAPLLADALLTLGARAAEERDGWCVSHLDLRDAEQRNDEDGLRRELVERLRALTGIEGIEAHARWRVEEDWAETWKRGLAPRAITDRILVRPSWLDAPSGSWEAVIVLDPGMAFGTAEHGTTRGCLRLLDGAVGPGERVLDIGSGSGILSIAAALLGAGEVLAIEGDDLACEALEENLERNGVDDRVAWRHATVDASDLAALGPADGVAANIESGVLRALMPGFAAAVRADGWLILSGIQAHEWDAIRACAEEAGFRFRRHDADEEWRSGLFRRLGPGVPSE